MSCTDRGAERRWHVLSNGARLEVLCMLAQEAAQASTEAGAAAGNNDPAGPPGEGSSSAPAADGASLGPPPPLVFVHGAFHGAWCWAEHFLPFFSAAGHDCYAVSLRGHGGSNSGPEVAVGAVGTLQSHAQDLASFIATLPRPPVLLVHSFAGSIAAKYISMVGAQAGAEAGEAGLPPLAGLALLGAVPPTGGDSMARRAAKRSPWRVARIAWSMIFKSYRTSPSACRFLFFSAELPQADVERHRAQLAAAAPAHTLVDRRGAALPQNAVPPAPPPGGWPHLPPAAVFVGCGTLDVLVDREAAEETADYFGVRAVMWEGLAHDLMLDARWQAAASSLREWLQQLPLGGKTASAAP